ncbi:hypothetical protein V6N13_108684 [Hibiscus sabdariffa]
MPPIPPAAKFHEPSPLQHAIFNEPTDSVLPTISVDPPSSIVATSLSAMSSSSHSSSTTLEPDDVPSSTTSPDDDSTTVAYLLLFLNSHMVQIKQMKHNCQTSEEIKGITVEHHISKKDLTVLGTAPEMSHKRHHHCQTFQLTIQ